MIKKKEIEIDFKAIFESSTDLYLILSPDFTILALSDAYEKASMKKRKDMIGKNVFDVFPDNPNDLSADGVSNLLASLNIVLKTKKEHAMAVQKYDIARTDGTFEERYWSPLNKPILNSKNKVDFIVHRVQDVTEFILYSKKNTVTGLNDALNTKALNAEIEIVTRSKQIQELNKQLIENEEKYSDLLENSVVGMFTTYMDTFKTIAVNNVAATMFGYDSKKDFIDNFHGPSCLVNEHEVEHVLKTLNEKGEIINSVHEVKKRDGTTFWMIMFTKMNVKKNIAHTVVRDITSQIIADKELKASEENYKNLFQNNLASMFTINLKTLKVINVNDVCVQLFKFKSNEEFLTEFKTQNHFVNEDERVKYRNVLLETGEISVVTEMKKKDGGHFWAKIFSKFNTEKSIVQTVLIDITQQMLFQEELENKVKTRTTELTASLIREKDINEMKSRFLSMASHEFRTPLSSILSSSGLIGKYTESDEQEKRLKHVNRINTAVKELTEILDDFLSVEQLEKGIIVGENSAFNLQEFLFVLAEEIEGIIKKKKLKLYLQHEGDTLIYQSKKVLRPILLNLLSNAIKYSPEGKKIHFTSSILNNKVTISIKDQGIGIPEEEQKHLFTEFFRAKNAENIQGTGLGLIISLKYLELLGGNISFISKINEGSTFSIEFPQKKIELDSKIKRNIAMN